MIPQEYKKLKILDDYAFDNKVKQFDQKDLAILLLIVPGTEILVKKNKHIEPEKFSELLNKHAVDWIVKISKKYGI